MAPDQNQNNNSPIDSAQLPPVAITSPMTLAVVTNSNSLTIAGDCVDGAVVEASGSGSGTANCVNGQFSMSLNSTIEGELTFNVTQKSNDTNKSNPVSVVWNRDVTAPSLPVLSSPSVNPTISNLNDLTVSGSCENGSTVSVSGALTQSFLCNSGSFSFSTSKIADADYHFLISQTDIAGNSSGVLDLSWIRDTVAPNAIVITNPNTNIYSSSETNVSLQGTCETGAMVNLSGAESDMVACANSQFAFSLTQNTDNVYNYSLTQTDKAGNFSAGASFQWTRNTTLPSNPVITSPSHPFYSKTNSITVTGTCTTGNTIEVSGSGTGSAICSSGGFSYNFSSTVDGAFTLNFKQKNAVGSYSGTASLTWNRDTVAPSVPVLTVPVSATTYSSNSSFNIAGSCENNATVKLAGADIQNTVCAAGAFSFSVTKTTDGSYAFSVSQTDLAGNNSSAVTKTWVRDSSLPNAPTITNHTSPYLSNTNSIVLSGACEINAAVHLKGDDTNSVTCVSGTYSFTINKSADGAYNFNLNQVDLAGNSSSATSFIWNRDATAPAALVILNPATSPYTSADNDLTINGSCETGDTVKLSGDASSSVTCAAGSFSLNVSQTSDGTYNYSLSQTDLASNSSAAVSLQWIRNSAVPETPVITSPVVNPYTSNAGSLAISGSCITGYAVELSGASTDSKTCSSGVFTFNVSQSTDGSYNYAIKQKSGTGIYSAAASLTWKRDSVAPSAPGISSPAVTPFYSNGNTLSLSGSCETGSTVNLSGGATASATCNAGTYSFSVNKASDGNYNLNVKQTDVAGNVSAASTVNWIRDSVAPAAVVITNPASNPFASGDSTISISGNCEAAATVAMTGSATGTLNCSALGTFNFSVSQTSDGTYNYSFVQTDRANNSSSATAFQWIRDTSVPSTPVISSPAVDPYYSNTNTITIKASCDTQVPTIVYLTGDVTESEVTSPAGLLSQSCDSSPVTFVVQKSTDGIFHFGVDQENPIADTTSASASLTWVRDTKAPAAPTISQPAVTPFTAPGNLNIVGGCEPNSTVNLAGDSAQTQTCTTSGTYQFAVSKTADGTYTFNIHQKDLAGNISAAKNLSWIRDSNSVPPPSISSPASNPFLSNEDTLELTGGCNTGYVVTLSGISASDVAEPLAQTCADGSYSYTITKTSDGVFAINLKQTFNAVDSALTNFNWTRDTVAPNVSLTSTPPAVNLTTAASFSFTADGTANFECKLDAANFASCTSPVSYESLTNGSHTFMVRATDAAGNTSPAQSYTWTQASYNTMALYHLNTAAPTTDSSSYTQVAGFNNNLTAVGTPANDTACISFSGSMSTCRTFGSGKNYSVNDNASLNVGTSTMTVEGFFKISTAIATNNYYYTLVSKNGNTSGTYGWEVRLRRISSNKYAIDFLGTTSNTTALTTVSSNNITMYANSWHYLAVTWNKGTVTFYQSSATGTVAAKGVRTIGTAGSAVLANSSAPLRLGTNVTSGTNPSQAYTGSLEELRISQVVRTIKRPTAEFFAD